MTDFDDQLRSELDRRSTAVELAREWARQELLPAVMSGIEIRPQRVATSRAPAFAGLAAAVALVLVLVVAVPRLSVSPGQTASAPDRSSDPSVLSAQEFAKQLEAGQLRDVSVLVDGTIGERPEGAAVECHVTSGERCLMGPLEETDPVVEVESRWFATDDRDPAVGASDVLWAWSHLPSGPISGALALNIDAGGTVEFLGKAGDSAADPPTLDVEQALELDPSDLGRDDVLLVQGTLVDTEPRNSLVTLDCEPDDFPPITTLPLRHCQWTDFISKEPLVDEQSPLDGRGPKLWVQRDTAGFLDGRTSAYGIYAVAPRLYGDDCGDVQPPCWHWEVVGSLSADPAQEPQRTTESAPTTPPIREVACEAGGQYAHIGAPIVSDEADLVLSCSVEPAGFDPGDSVEISNPGGDLRRLKVAWRGTPCDIATRWVVFQRPEGYVLNGARPTVDCDAMAVSHAMTLELNRDVDSQTLSAVLTGPGTFSTPTPDTHWLGCWAGPPDTEPDAIRALVKIIDETGLIALCEGTTSPASGVRNQPLVVENPDGDEHVLRLTWEGVCNLSGRFRLRPSSSGFELVVSVPSHDIICDGFPVAHDVLIYLDEPMPRASLQTTFVEEPPPFGGPTAPPTDARWELAPTERPTDSD